MKRAALGVVTPHDVGALICFLLGPAAANEGFTTDYDLPNDTAYAETCASVALIFWAQRMLNLDCDGAYADVAVIEKPIDARRLGHLLVGGMAGDAGSDDPALAVVAGASGSLRRLG